LVSRLGHGKRKITRVVVCLIAEMPRVAAEEDASGFGFSTRRYYSTGSSPRGRPRRGAACRSTTAAPPFSASLAQDQLYVDHFRGGSVARQHTVRVQVGSLYFGSEIGQLRVLTHNQRHESTLRFRNSRRFIGFARIRMARGTIAAIASDGNMTPTATAATWRRPPRALDNSPGQKDAPAPMNPMPLVT
jgi:hypothetical protein